MYKWVAHSYVSIGSGAAHAMRYRLFQALPEAVIHQEIDDWVVAGGGLGEQCRNDSDHYRKFPSAASGGHQGHDRVRSPTEHETSDHQKRQFGRFDFGLLRVQCRAEVGAPSWNCLLVHLLDTAVDEPVSQCDDGQRGEVKESENCVDVSGVCGVGRLPFYGARRSARFWNVGGPSEQRDNAPKEREKPQGCDHREHRLSGHFLRVRPR